MMAGQHTILQAVVEHLAADEADLRARVHDLEAEVMAYRDALRAALDVAASVTRDRDALRQRYHAALDELRALRLEQRGTTPRRAA